MAQGALLNYMLGELQQNGTVFDCKAQFPDGMSIHDFATKVGDTFQLHAKFDFKKEPTKIARGIVTALTKEQGAKFPIWFNGIQNKISQVSGSSTAISATNANGKRATEGNDTTPAPTPKKPRKPRRTKAQIQADLLAQQSLEQSQKQPVVGGNQVLAAATIPKQTPNKAKGNGNATPVTQSSENTFTIQDNSLGVQNNNFGIQNNNIGFENNYTLANKAQAPKAPSFKRKINNEKTETRPAKRSNVVQPDADSAFGEHVGTGMGQMSLLTPPESGLPEINALFPVAQIANMGQESPATDTTGKVFYGGNGMAFPVPNLVTDPAAHVTKTVVAQPTPIAKTTTTQPAATTTSSGMKLQNSMESTSSEPSKLPSMLAAGPIEGAAPESNTISSGVNAYFFNQANTTALQAAFEGLPKHNVIGFIAEKNKRQNAVDGKIEPELAVDQSALTLTGEEEASLFGDELDEAMEIEEAEVTQQAQYPNQERINELTRLDSSLPLSVINSFINPHKDCPYSAVKEVMAYGNYGDQSHLLFDQTCRALAKEEYDAQCRTNFQINETDKPEWDPTIRNAEKRSRKKKQRAEEQKSSQQQQANSQPPVPKTQSIQANQDVQNNISDAILDEEAKQLELNAQLERELMAAMELDDEPIPEATTNTQPEIASDVISANQWEPAPEVTTTTQPETTSDITKANQLEPIPEMTTNNQFKTTSDATYANQGEPTPEVATNSQSDATLDATYGANQWMPSPDMNLEDHFRGAYQDWQFANGNYENYHKNPYSDSVISEEE
ncbi:hypothetical protein EDB81DRAFT_878962 [Dactylonectria macrodidyma]|uniref:Uncharacterized protein n=1 Tax=Dactylonectria macrodidyma TaxID=307937 RepID=A0A9P9FET0_9HYPO|nr:hypothetical protein EDB81DRAFT_878962 [Dactylonectria macrodidyma]